MKKTVIEPYNEVQLSNGKDQSSEAHDYMEKSQIWCTKWKNVDLKKCMWFYICICIYIYVSCIIPFTWHSEKGKAIETENRAVLPSVEGGKNIREQHKGILGSDETVPYSECGQNSEDCILKQNKKLLFVN